ncbi:MULTISPECIES: hypothetical protein [Bifidobacterium]|uniref:Transposase n=2 Tax=Bifidobacterium TaxID=1678 RepID=A0A261FTL0_9BIFI|nr:MULTISPECIES: hypothetical protein [Bifidobacterium]OZG62497.1 transposase [Bifidobacterium lemurum]OZG69033.1 transposase [Bifidobacterium eulemuris]
MSRKEFDARQLRYLRRLSAVESVTATKIRYSRAFQLDCMRRYILGDHPTAIFRDAGLDPSIIGYKRIERCIARWRQDPDIMTSVRAGDSADLESDCDMRLDDGEPLPAHSDDGFVPMHVFEAHLSRVNRLEHCVDDLQKQLAEVAK